LTSVFVVTRHFPPIGSPGASIRLVKLMKYALRRGWSFTVLTIDPDRPVVPEEKASGFLLKDLNDEVQIERIGNPLYRPHGLLKLLANLMGDSSLPWSLKIIGEGKKLLHQKKADLIFVNAPPFTNLFAGTVLSLLSSTPIVMDIKDDWVGSPDFFKKPWWRRKIESWLQGLFFELASCVIVVTEKSFHETMERYPKFAKAGKFVFIPNGHDLDEYHILEQRTKKIETRRFTLLSAAAGYRPDYRDLTPFLNGLDVFIKRCPEAKEKLELVFLGEKPVAYEELINQMGLGELTFYAGMVDRERMVEWLWDADLLFLVQPRGNTTAISGTLYEYWAVGKAPILLISEEGASSALVKDHHLGEHVGFDQPEKVADVLEKIYRAYRSGKPIWIDRAGVERYNRKLLADQMMECWQKAIRSNKASR